MPKFPQRRFREGKHFRDLCALAGEGFTDYLLIVRTKANGLEWRASNGSWGIGVAEKFLHAQEQAERRYEQEDD